LNYWILIGASDDEGVNIYDFRHILCELFHAFVKIRLALKRSPAKPFAVIGGRFVVNFCLRPSPGLDRLLPSMKFTAIHVKDKIYKTWIGRLCCPQNRFAQPLS
jgi:hypothetical protein